MGFTPKEWTRFRFVAEISLRCSRRWEKCLHLIDRLVLDPRGQEGVQSDVLFFKPGGGLFHEMDGELAGPFVHHPDR